MYEAADFLRNLALVMCVAAITSVVFQRLRQPVVFGYLLAGLIIGPHIAVPLVADESAVRALAELGVILLMFGLGLEFSLRKLLGVGLTAGFVALAETSLMVWFGFLVGQLFGWTVLESVFTGAVIAISSTTIIVKAFADQRVTGKSTEIVFGILIFEDIVGIFLIAILTAVVAGAGLSAGSVATTAAQLTTFLVGLVGVGLLIIPRLVRYVVGLGRDETVLVTSVGICFAAALLALTFGYSVALGAFIAGSLVAESGEERVVARLVAPVRDMFAAIFFVAVGMLIDPLVIAENWAAVLVLSAVVIVGKVSAVSVSAFLTGFPLRTSVQTGMSVAQIGEFSFIIAGVGLASGATRGFLYPVAIAVSAVTTLTTPWLIRASGPVASYVDRKLPRPLQMFVGLYGSWMERLRSAPSEAAGESQVHRLVRGLLLDAALLAALIIGASLESGLVTPILVRSAGISEQMARVLVFVAVGAVAVPLSVGLLRSARLLGLTLSYRALPKAVDGAVDFAAAPRKVLTVTLQFIIVALVGIPIATVTLPFLPPLRGVAVLVVILVVLTFGFWRSASSLQGHARAGAELIIATLASQMAEEPEASDGDEGEERLLQVHRVLPGLGDPVAVLLPADSPAVHRTLAELDLRGLTGATVLAIRREGEPVVIPTGREQLRAGDVLAVAGTQEAVTAAGRLLTTGEEYATAGQ